MEYEERLEALEKQREELKIVFMKVEGAIEVMKALIDEKNGVVPEKPDAPGNPEPKKEDKKEK